MAGHGEALSRKQEAAIAALLSCRTVRRAAAKAGVSERSLHTWLTLPEFVAEYRAARKRIVEAALGRLQRSTAKAAAALERNLRCGRPADEIRAAAVILDNAVRAVEVLDLGEQIAELRQQIEGRR